jgi:hypothetical protein
MKKTVVISIAILVTFVLYFGNNVLAERAEMEAVRVPLENYLMGHKTGKAEFMKKAFHTEGKLMYIRDDKYNTIDFKDYIGRMKGIPAKDEAMRKRRIESIEISGNVAVGKIILDYPNATFTDYMTLLKIDGEWKIVNKAFDMKQNAQK